MRGGGLLVAIVDGHPAHWVHSSRGLVASGMHLDKSDRSVDALQRGRRELLELATAWPAEHVRSPVDVRAPGGVRDVHRHAADRVWGVVEVAQRFALEAFGAA